MLTKYYIPIKIFKEKYIFKYIIDMLLRFLDNLMKSRQEWLSKPYRKKSCPNI